MAPARLSPEEALQRKRDSKRRYQAEHAEELREKRRMAVTDEMRAKWREDRREKIAKLVEAGLLEKLSPGRKRLYTPEEALEAAKRQRRECYHRFKARVDAANAILAQGEVDG